MMPTDPAGARARAVHPDEETRYRAVAELDLDDPADRAVLLDRLADASWRVRTAAVERIARGPRAEAALPGLLAVLAAGPGVGAREAAAAALARIGAPAVPPLVERLSSGDADLRQGAAGVLGEIADARAVAPLTAQLADPDPNVRGAAADALGRIGGTDARAALHAAADSDDATLRRSAIEALATMRACLPASRAEALLDDRSLRRSIFRMIGACDELAPLPLLARGVADAARSVREAALGAVGAQRARREPAELGPLLAEVRTAAALDPGLTDAWATALGAEDASVAVGALTALSAAGAARHAGAIVRLADDERLRALVEEALDAFPQGGELRDALAAALPRLGPLARITAIAALARLGSPASFETVVREASDGSSIVQGEAIAALGRLRDARGVPPLAGLVGDDDGGVAGLAASALVRIAVSGGAEREAVLAAVRARAEARASAAVLRVLGSVGGAGDVATVAHGLEATGAPERAAAAAALGSLAQRGLLPHDAAGRLVVSLGDPTWSVRAAAARAVADAARGRGPEATALRATASAALVRLLGDPEHAVRAAAAEALGACGPGRTDELAALARDPEAPALVVVAALHALAAVGPAPADAIERALGHEDPEVRKEAALGAARVPGDEGARLLRAAAASPRWDVRRAAAEGMRTRGDPALRADAERLAAADPDPLVARAFADAARALGPQWR